MTSLAPSPTEDRPQGDLRVRSARGAIINSGFQIFLSLLGLVRRVAVAGFLTRKEFGVWGIMLSVLITMVWLKQVGVQDKYVQQREVDQEHAYQKAFTIELLLSSVYFVLCCIALPLYAIAYDRGEIVLPGLVLSTSVMITAFETPAWIPYRRLEYARHRSLTAVDPVVSIVATIALAAAGFGVWGLVAGALIGSVAGAAVCVATSPYRLRLRLDRGTLREYVRFSGPLLGLGLTNLLIIQGSLLTINKSAGIAGVGAVGLASTFANFADRVDSIVSQTIYPAVCAALDRTEVLVEVFTKSNRLALMWSLPFGTGLALFAGDLVHFLIGDRWEDTIGLLAVFGLACAAQQIAFNWSVFMRATNRTGPLLVAALVGLASFLGVVLPLSLVWGINGYAAAFAISTVIQILVRTLYVRSLFPGFPMVRHIFSALVTGVPPAVLILGLRLVDAGGRSLAHVIAELVMFVVATLASIAFFDRPLLLELTGYLRGRRPRPAGALVLDSRP